MKILTLSLLRLRKTIISKASALVRSYFESDGAMARFFSKYCLAKNVPQRSHLSAQFSPQEQQSYNYAHLWTQNGSGNFLIEKGFWKGIDRACDSSLAGYVPYVRDHTKIGVYHFWSVNYGLRKQLLGHVVLVKNGEFIISYKFILPAYHFAVIDMKDLFDFEEGDNIYVEVYHPKIPKGHGGHGGQLRYWGMYGDYLSTVHSMPVQKISFHEKMVQSSRGTFPDDMFASDLVKRGFHWGRQRLFPASTKNISEATHAGYYVVDQGEKMGSSVWHSSEYIGIMAKRESQVQAIALPPIQSIDVLISFVEALGLSGKVNFLLYKKSVLLDRVSQEVDPATQLLVSQVFPNTDLAGGVLIVDLSEHGACIHAGYIHLIYTLNEHICDCVHSHALKADRLKEVYAGLNSAKKGNSQSLKFMHFPATVVYQSWVAIWTLDESVPIKLRFFSSEGKEYVLNMDIPPVGVCYLEVSKLFQQLAGNPSMHVVVQIESGFANLDANLFTYSQNANSLSVDHFTGG